MRSCTTADGSALIKPSRRTNSNGMRLRTSILGFGAYVPEHSVTNEELERTHGIEPGWIRSRTGIQQRHVLDEGRATSDMATEAALRACRSAEVDPAEIELIIVGTVTPDYVLPSTAGLVQHRIGARRAAGFDLEAACTGFINALMTADALVQTGWFRNALVIGADAMTRIVDPAHPETFVLFGDGAGAMVIGGGEGRATLLDHLAGIDGSGARRLFIPAGGSRQPLDAAALEARAGFLHMEGREVFRFATEAFPASVRELVTRNACSLDQLALVVPHQANLRILEAASKRLGIPMERVVVDLDLHGNTGAASIPLALEGRLARGPIEPGSLVCLAGFGAGLSWGASLLRWNG